MTEIKIAIDKDLRKQVGLRLANWFKDFDKVKLSTLKKPENAKSMGKLYCEYEHCIRLCKKIEALYNIEKS